MLDQQLDNDLHPQLTCLLNKSDNIRQFAEPGIDLQVVADVIPFVQKRGKVKMG